MNVLILTPDAVGSTLLQRTLTIYMQFCEFDRPVINLHELSNGLAKYYSPEFNQELLGKKQGAWGYHQSLNEVVDLLESVDHYKTSRLAHYHIRSRQDPLADQVPFYNYLNENFFIISCTRKNVFEHALSWTINQVTKKLNVYSTNEKVDTFLKIYKNPISIDVQSLVKCLDHYVMYLEWCNNFQISSYFEYEKHVPDIENYILNLPFYQMNNRKKTFKDVYGITFNDWNRTHFYTGDIGSIAESLRLTSDNEEQTYQPWESKSIQIYNQLKDPSWPNVSNPAQFKNLPENIQKEIREFHNVDLSQHYPGYALSAHLPTKHQEFIQKNREQYNNALDSMEHMTKLGIIPSIPPMKKQTLREKKMIVKNFDECVEAYNQWQKNHCDIAEPYVEQMFIEQNQTENSFWNTSNTKLLD